jgi:hypothetical protein
VIGMTCWAGVFIVVIGVLIILVVREGRRQRPLNLADRTKHSHSLGSPLLTGNSAHDPDWLVSDSGRMTGLTRNLAGTLLNIRIAGFTSRIFPNPGMGSHSEEKSRSVAEQANVRVVALRN